MVFAVHDVHTHSIRRNVRAESCSVVICAYTLDRWDDLAASIDSVRRQTLAPTQLILVVDHNDELFARAQAEFPDVTVISSENPAGLSGARNAGLSAANGDVVAFIDDDAMASESWIENLLAGYTDDSILGVGGFISPLWEAGRPSWFPEEFDWVVGCSYRGMSTSVVRNLIGANMSFRREVLEAVGGFSSELGRTSTQALAGEEAGVSIRASRLYPGGVFVYVREARVDHRVPVRRTSWRYFHERCYAEGISKARLTQMLGSREGLSSERHHALVTLPAGVGRNLVAPLHGDVAGLSRAFVIATGLATTATGYAIGRLTPPPETAVVAVAPPAADAAPARRPRVLMVTPRYFPLVGGVELHVAQVAQRLSKDVDVTVLTTDTTGELPEREVVDGVQVRRVRAWPRNRDYYFAPAISSAIRHGDWDLVHVQSYHSAVAPLAMIASLRAHVPYVLTFHGGGHSSRLRNSLRRTQWMVLQPLFSRARKLIAVAEFEAEQFSAALHLPRDRFVVIPNGSDLSAIEVQPERRKAGSRPMIVSVGRLERYKGHQRVIEAMPLVLKAFPDSTLRILGTGPYEAPLEELIEKLGLGDSVTVTSIPADDRRTMAQTLAWSSLVVLMSEFETHPLAIIEALQLGRPVLVGDSAGLREIAGAGRARVVPLESTPEELAAAIVEELRHCHTAVPLEASTWDECAERIREVYYEVLSLPMSPTPSAPDSAQEESE
jgi:glycosyltransferase involved in cell wall biosynthesis/GT2 family glycosyltransferase